MRRRRVKERGAELVELTLVFPLLILLGMGMLDAGMAFKSKMEVVQATRQGARVGSSFSDDVESDHEAILALTSVIPKYLNLAPGDTTSARLDFVVIYKATATDGEVPTACLSGDVANLCQHMTRAEVENYLANPAAQPIARVWTNRPTNPEDLESLGVYIQATQPSFTGVLQGFVDWTVSANTVMRTEPED